MKKKHILQGIVACLVLGLTFVFSVQCYAQCCLGPPGKEAAIKTLAAAKERTLKDVERDIDAAKQNIHDLEKYATDKQTAGDDFSKFANEPGDSEEKKEYGNIASDFYEKAVKAEKAIEQERKRLATLEQERQTMISQTGGCFLPDTLVTMADGSVKPFERIRPGDQVLTYDIGYQTTVSKPVIGVYTVEGNHLYTINGELSTTGGERLLSGSGWKRVRDLQEGDKVHINGRMVEIVSIDCHRTDHKLYNIQVDDSHNFYVVTSSGERYLVHNTSGGGAK